MDLLVCVVIFYCWIWSVELIRLVRLEGVWCVQGRGVEEVTVRVCRCCGRFEDVDLLLLFVDFLAGQSL